MTVVIDDFSPMYVGDTLIPFAPIFQHRDGSNFDLTGATLSMKMLSATGTKVCSGVWVIDNATSGKAHYPWQAGDVDTAGIWTLYVEITVGGQFVHADTKTLEIKAVPS